MNSRKDRYFDINSGDSRIRTFLHLKQPWRTFRREDREKILLCQISVCQEKNRETAAIIINRHFSLDSVFMKIDLNRSSPPLEKMREVVHLFSFGERNHEGFSSVAFCSTRTEEFIENCITVKRRYPRIQ